MVRITVIWLSVKYQTFFSFQNVTSPPQAVNVPFLSSHLKVSRSSLEPNLSTWQFYFPCRFTSSWIKFFFKEIFLVIRNFCITMFEIELVFRRAERRCSGSLFSMLLFKKLYLIQIFNQYLLNKKDDSCPLLHTNISAWIEFNLFEGVKKCHEHSMVKFVSTRDYLIPPLCIFLAEQERKEGCTSASFSHYILRTETKTSSAKDQRIYYMITKCFHAPWNYQMNLLVSMWFLFCFVFIWDESVTSCFHQKYRKSFYSYS